MNMNKISLFTGLAAIGSCLLFSCQKEVDNFQPAQDSIFKDGLRTYTCVIANQEDSKVSVDAAGKTAWEDGDRILIHGRYVADNMIVPLDESTFSGENKIASFEADLSGIRPQDSKLYVAYPADSYIGLSGSESSYNSYYSGFNDTNKPLMAGYLDGTTFKFYNLCGLFTFKVDGDYDGYIFEGNRAEIVGYDEYRVKIIQDSAPDFNHSKTAKPKTSITGTVTGDGTSLNYIYFPNGATFEHGFTLYFTKDGVIKDYITSSKSISVERGHQKNIGLIDSGVIHTRAMTLSAINAIDLNNHDGAIQAPANCYQLVRSSAYRDKIFKIWAVKGNDISQPITGIASLEVLWESRCEGSGTTTPGFIVKSLDFDKNHIYFQTPEGDNLKDGNGVIAAKDSEGNILWSWHIWVSYTDVTTISSPGLASTPVMDRNLGALKVSSKEAAAGTTAYGLLYQWGRKDPFLGARYENSGSAPGFVSAGERTFSVNSGQITLDNSIKNPMLIGYSVESEPEQKNWCTAETSDANFWSASSKTIYDPCPSGYRVMKRDSSLDVWKADDLSTVTGWFVSTSYYSFAFGDTDEAVVFPLAGYRDGSLTVSYPGVRAAVWSATSYDDNRARFLNIRTDSSTYQNARTGKGRSYSVRCVAE